MTVGQRIEKIRIALGSDDKKMTLEEFGSRLGVSKNAISNIENGRRNLTDQMCKAICREFSVSEEWLRNGIGGDDVIFESSPEDAAALFAKENHLEDIERILIKEYLKLNDKSKEVFRAYLRNVVSEFQTIQKPTAAAPKNPAVMTREELHADMDAQLDAEEASEKSQALQSGSEDIADEA